VPSLITGKLGSFHGSKDGTGVSDGDVGADGFGDSVEGRSGDWDADEPGPTVKLIGGGSTVLPHPATPGRINKKASKTANILFIFTSL